VLGHMPECDQVWTVATSINVLFVERKDKGNAGREVKGTVFEIELFGG
jgi:hypothetical protein